MRLHAARAARTAFAALLLPAALAAQAPASGTSPLQRAATAWDRGDYPAALEQYQALVGGAEAERWRRDVALATGELWHTTELAPDGRALRVSPRGALVAFETGSGAERRTHVHRLADGAGAAELPGFGASFSADDAQVAYVRTAEAVGAGDATIVVRQLASGEERVHVLAGRRVVGAPALSADGRRVFVLASAGQDTSVTLYELAENAAPKALTESGTVKGDLTLVPGGRHLIFTEGRRTRTSPPPAFVVKRIDGPEWRWEGHAPSANASGSAVAFLQQRGDSTSVQVHDFGGANVARVLLTTTDRLDAPALSPDGRRVAYQRMAKDDWEIFVVDAGGADRRLTREIQHDLFPRWLSNDRLLAVVGEARHRRAHVYDAATGERTKVFHNNTVRTIAPEYEWAPTPDGARLVIVAERDGDTISPERGVYVTDLRREVTADELRARLRAMAETEGELRRRGAAMYAPIADSVRAAVAAVSATTLYGYQEALSGFDSRFVGRPGNVPAGQWLHDELRRMGYATELQWFEPMGLARTANVVATLPGTTHPDLAYVVGAHYDSHQNGPGADDDATGTAMVLELARVLKDRPLPATIVFVLFTGEEAGLLGSREFARRAGDLRVAGALNNDMFGWSNDHVLDNTIRYSNPGVRDVQHAGAFLFSELVTFDARYYKNTDAHALFDAWGDVIGGIGSYPVLGNPHYHQAHDLLETINQRQVQETTKATLAALMLLASSPERPRELKADVVDGALELRWAAARERDVAAWRVRYTDGDGRERTLDVAEPRARVPGVRAGAPIPVSVRAVNRRGLESWDAARP